MLLGVLLFIVLMMYESSTLIKPVVENKTKKYSLEEQKKSLKELILEKTNPEVYKLQTAAEKVQEKIRTGCGQCTNALYNRDCIVNGIKYTCAAGSWQTFADKTTPLVSDANTSSTSVSKDVPIFSAPKPSKRVYMICGEHTCRTPVKFNIGWKNIGDVIKTITKIDPAFLSKVEIPTSYQLTSLGPANSSFGILKDDTIVKTQNSTLINSNDPADAIGVWVYGDEPSKEWIEFLKTEGFGVQI